MEAITEDKVRVIITAILKEFDNKKVDVTLCTEKHKEVDQVSKKLDKLIFLFLGTFLTGLAAVVVALVK